MFAEMEMVASKLCIETENKPKKTTALARALLHIRIQKSWTYNDDTFRHEVHKIHNVTNNFAYHMYMYT